MCFGGVASAVVIETVPMDNMGRFAGATGYGSVDYSYNIGKYEVTTGQYAEFLNAVARTDTYGLYNELMSLSAYACRIQRTGSPGNYSYFVPAGWENRPVNYVSWGDAARFVNWLHNGQKAGDQDASTTERGVYQLDGAVSQAALTAASERQPGWTWAIPTEDEWSESSLTSSMPGIQGGVFPNPRMAFDPLHSPAIRSVGRDFRSPAAEFFDVGFRVMQATLSMQSPPPPTNAIPAPAAVWAGGVGLALVVYKGLRRRR